MPLLRSQIEDIKAEALNLGFDVFGIALPQPTPHTEFYQQWITGGYHAEMQYLSNQRAISMRKDPRLILPSAQSVIVLATRYTKPHDLPTEQQKGLGRISAYACSQDYHHVIPPRVEILVQTIQKIAGVTKSIEALHYTDTGPVMEKDFASQAGLGWVGKNTCLISPLYGSYIFLSVCFLNLEMEPSPPFLDDRCGNCQRCISACPTQCIRPERFIDARRCISYLTIEHRRVIPVEIRPAMSNWVFGCDICQMVCPWNKRVDRLQTPVLIQPKEDLFFPQVFSELGLTDQEFKQKYGKTPISRTRRKGYIRNLAVVAGNLRHPACISPLSKLLSDEPDAIIRGHAAWALGNYHLKKTKQILLNRLRTEPEPYVRAEIINALNSQ
ncbi:MAG: tRNA epoxyqueuosine(34) reductase QueG [Anaerolineae bacterium]|nr:tRNA epoxyqueuosine(34) reductase QueG [Anaerolineae bacterium]